MVDEAPPEIEQPDPIIPIFHFDARLNILITKDFASGNDHLLALTLGSFAEPEYRQFRRPFPQNRKVMADQVMAKKALSPLGQVVKLTRGPLE
jgi:hypothetical protein